MPKAKRARVREINHVVASQPSSSPTATLSPIARELTSILVVSQAAAFGSWVLRLIKNPFLAHTAMIVAITAPALAVLGVLYAWPGIRQRLTAHRPVRAAWLLTIGVLAAVLGFGVWTLASPARLEIDNTVATYEDSWRDRALVNPGDTVAVRVTLKNAGRGVARAVLVGNNLPPNVEYLENTTTLYNPNNPSGIGVPDGITRGRLDVGNYGPGSGGHVIFQVRISPAAPRTTLTNIGVASIAGSGEVWDGSTIDVLDTE